MPVRRNKDGLTPKQVACIPELAIALTLHQGINICIEKGLMGSKRHFYNVWMREPVFVKAMNEERARVQGEIRDRTEQLGLAWEEAIFMEVVKVAVSERHDKMRAAEMFLTIRGYETGKGTRFTNVTNVQTVAVKQEAFAERVRQATAERFKDLFDASGNPTSGGDAEGRE